MFDISETFRPSYGKLILTAVIFLLFAPTINIDTGIRCIDVPCPPIGQASFAFALAFGKPIIGFDPFGIFFWFGISYVFLASILSFFSEIKKTRLIRRS